MEYMETIMKHLIITALLCVAVAVDAQKIAQNNAVVTYSLPYAQGYADIKYQRIEQTPGIFYQYAERYLGKVDIITKASTEYRLKGVTLRTKTTADTAKTFVLDITKQMPKLTIDNKGILVAVGDYDIDDRPAATPKSPAERRCGAGSRMKLPAPLTEEQLRAGSVAKMAESTAKMIYRIREDRINLMSGETEAPDGEALKKMLQELERTEKQLMELFVGVRDVDDMETSIPFALDKAMNSGVLFRFSKYSGVAQADDLAGEAVMIDVVTEAVKYAPQKKEAKTPEWAIYYNQPGRAYVKIYDTAETLAERKVTVPQLGVVVPMPQSVIQEGKTVILDPKTGAVKQIK